MIKNIVLHFNLITKHRHKVFKLCVKAGIPFRGLVHDLSKYSWTEFSESVKYYNGTCSPIINCKNDIGYSNAWLHHKGRNKHHYEYWYDYALNNPTPVIPYKYTVEMICDCLAAGMTYQGKKWNKEYQLSYFEKTKDVRKINPKIENILYEVFKEVSENGVDATINPKILRRIYDKHINS